MATDEVMQQERYERQLAKAIVRAERAEAERDAMREALKEFEWLLSLGICTTDAWRNARDKARTALAPSPAGRED